MRLEILGCGSGLGQGLETTALLIDDDVLVDTGTGVGHLRHDRMMGIRHVLLSHSHLDHIAGLPLLLVNIYAEHCDPLVLYGLQETLEAIHRHIFNDIIWPDFSRLPSPDRGLIRFHPLAPGEILELGSRQVQMIPVNHVVPAVGYRIESSGAAFAYTGDTTSNDTFWNELNRHEKLDLLIAEVAMPNRAEELCQLAKHYSPRLLAEDLRKLRHRPDLYISHLPPTGEEQIMRECLKDLAPFRPRRLTSGQLFNL